MTNDEAIYVLKNTAFLGWSEQAEKVSEAVRMAVEALKAQPEERTEERTETHACDSISRRAAVDVLNVGTGFLRRVLDGTDIVGAERAKYEWGLGLIESYISDMKDLPSVQPETSIPAVTASLDSEEIERVVRKIKDAPVMQLPSVQPEDCDTCKHGYFGDDQCERCRVRYPSHYERRTDGEIIPE